MKHFFSYYLITWEGHKRISYTHIDELNMAILETRRKEHTLTMLIWIAILNVSRTKSSLLMVRSQSKQSTRLFLQSSELGQPPPPRPQANMSPPFGWGVAHFIAGEGGGGGSQFAREDRHCGTPGIYCEERM